MRRLLSLILITCCTGSFAIAQKKLSTPLQNGDLLFQDLDCGELCNAIEQVTKSYGGRHFSHVGMVSIEGAFTFVIEAMGTEVKRTPIDEFERRNKNEILLGRVKKEYRSVVPEAVLFTLGQIGAPYDDAFLYGNGKYYCSELFYDAFRIANQGQDFFALDRMTFKDAATGAYFPAWEEYYRKLQVDIPEGQPGTNPGGLSRSDKLDIFLYRK